MDDFFEFRLVNLTAIFDNPLKSYLSSTETILSMFWTRAANSVSEFFELTEENRRQDKWLSVFLKRARHGSMEHELYCFMLGLPAVHTGSWMLDEDDVLCGNAACKVLPRRWQSEMLDNAWRPWEERRSEECHIC